MMVLGVVGAVAGAVGAIMQAQSAASAARYNQQVNERNAKIALDQGEADAQRQRRVNAQRLGALQASYGDAGIGFEGDAISVFSDASTQAALDEAQIKYNAKLRSIGYTDQATLDGMQAQAASTAGIFGAFSAITGAGRSILQAA